jgi:hypothetical protein
MNLWRIDNGKLVLDFHPGQGKAWQSERRYTLILAGTQSGKTAYDPWYLYQQIRKCGAGDYLAITATFDLFKLKFLPAMREVFEHVLRIGRYWSGDRIIELCDPSGKFLAQRADDPMWGRIILRSAESDSGLESATAKAAVLDEAGMRSFTQDTFDAVHRRLSLSRGPMLINTTLYTLQGWLRKLYDRALSGDPDIELIQFDSTSNPAFPPEEFERARRDMPRWKFNMQYRGRYDRPVGLIYDSFDPTTCKVPRFAIPPTWPRYLGLDFGGVNTAGVFYAAEPNTARLFAYREYHAGGRTAKEHAEKLREGEPMIPKCVGGSKSEGQWRKEFASGGLPVLPPAITEVEIGINRVYGAHKRNEILVFDDLHGYLDQKETYSRKLDANNEPTEGIEDKETFHFLDAERYIIGYLKGAARTARSW